MAKDALASTNETEQKVTANGGGASLWLTLSGAFLRRREASVLLVAIGLILYFYFSKSAFLSSDNIQNLGNTTARFAIVATGEVMLLICGEIDLSVGQITGLAPFIMYSVSQQGAPLWLGIIVALLACAGIGLINGVVTVLLKVPSFITTLGTLFLISGLTLTISNAFSATVPDQGSFFNEVMGHGPYAQIIWALIIVVIMQVVLSGTRWGLHTFAAGGNSLGASEVGVNINRVKIGNFMLASVLGGFAGLLVAFNITSIDPGVASNNDIMFFSVAGAVIGGTALQGGLGTIVGAFLGTFVLTLIKNGFNLLGVNAFTFDLILGAAILISMILNVRLQEWRKGSEG